MAVKTITIDLDAYERLRRLREGKASFSQVIKKYLPAPDSTAGDLLERLDGVSISDVSDETLDAIDVAVDERRRHPVQVPRW
jgi:predicted CopG family antitoxin